MILTESVEEGRLCWRVVSDADDLRAQEVSRAGLVRTEVSFTLPPEWSPDGLHADAHALAALLTLRPFIGERLVLPRPVSSTLARVTQAELGVRLEPVDPTLGARTVPDGRVGLAFSGGVDSVAALSVLPTDTVCVFLDRVRPAGVETPTKYRPGAARYACAEIERRGRKIYTIPTDLEFVRRPVGFPVFDRSSVESNGVGLVLLADWLGLDAVAWGTVAEVSYGTGFGRFVDHAANVEHRAWRRVFAAVGLGVVSPLIGVSEIGALRMLESSEFRDVAQSCVRGDVGEPCLNCWKCVRKTLGTSALSGDWPATDELARLLLVREFRSQLRFSPVPLGGVLVYGLARAPECAELAWLLRLRLGVTGADDAVYLERWYSPAADLWPEKYRGELADELDRRMGRMSDAEAERFRRWDPEAREGDAAVRALALAAVRYLDALADEAVAQDLQPLYRPFREVLPPRTGEDRRLAELADEEAELTQQLEELRSSKQYRRGNSVVRIARKVLRRAG